jgi:acetyl-CoA carboxylase biotin carboxyl carrier protein
MKTLNSSMAGTVFKVMVSAGDEVTAGQTVIVLESMKMEIPVDAEFNGKVLEVLVAEGDFVNEGDAVISFEA